MFGLVNLPCVCLWAMFGQQMRRLRALNVVMAVLLVATRWPVVTG